MAACEGWVHWWPGLPTGCCLFALTMGCSWRTYNVDLGPLDWEHTGRLHRDRRENRAPWFLFAFFLTCVPCCPASGLLRVHATL